MAKTINEQVDAGALVGIHRPSVTGAHRIRESHIGRELREMAEMNEQRARDILNDYHLEKGISRIRDNFASWILGDTWADLDGAFSADELEAIAWWMRNNAGSVKRP